MAGKFAQKPKGGGVATKRIQRTQEKFIDGAGDDTTATKKNGAGDRTRSALKTANVNMRWPPELKSRLDRAVEAHNEENPIAPISMNQWVINAVHEKLHEGGF
jgi:predicted HicB family RNase H-like nuclease